MLLSLVEAVKILRLGIKKTLRAVQILGAITGILR
jgi:hypothetical protein